MLHTLTPAGRAFLEEARFAILATRRPDNSPQQSVVWYFVDGDDLVFNTRAGRHKDEDMRRDPRVSVCVADGYKYIEIHGAVQRIDDQAVAQQDIRRLAIRYHGPEKGTRMADTEFSKQERVTYRLPLRHIGLYGFEE